VSEPTPIYIVDDEVQVCKALARLLTALGYVARTYQSAQAFLEDIGDAESGVAIVDYEMPVMNGLQLQQRLDAEGRHWQVIFYTARGELQGRRGEAADFLLKPAPGLKILAGVNGALQRLERHRQQLATVRDRVAALTHEEQRVMQGLAAGRKGREIAAELGCDPVRVRALRTSVMRKLEVRSSAQLRKLMESAAL
jgi:FixJ family two-component response regulator